MLPVGLWLKKIKIIFDQKPPAKYKFCKDVKAKFCLCKCMTVQGLLNLAALGDIINPNLCHIAISSQSKFGELSHGHCLGHFAQNSLWCQCYKTFFLRH